jgi:hypothetical protein
MQNKHVLVGPEATTGMLSMNRQANANTCKVSHGLNVSLRNIIIHKMQCNTMLYILSDALAIHFSTH